MQAFLRLMNALGPMGKDISEVNAAAPENLTVVAQIDDRSVELVLGNRRFLRRVQSFLEHYAEIRQNEHERASISNIAGAWSTGEFGTLLLQTQILLKTQPVVFEGNADLDGTAAAIYTVDISEQNSPWDLVIRAEHFRIPFRTKVWVSRATGHVLKIARASMGVPEGKGISGIHWGVTLEPVELNGKTWLLPRTGEYTVLYEQSGRREWNQITFSNYHRYGSEVTLRFQ